MDISSHLASISGLSEAIKIYVDQQKQSLDQPALNLLARLAGSRHAAEALHGFKLENTMQLDCVLRTCVESEQLSRTFRQHISNKKNIEVLGANWEKYRRVTKLY